MVISSFSFVAFLLLTSFLAAAAAFTLVIISTAHIGTKRTPAEVIHKTPPGAVFLFDHETLVDAAYDAEPILGAISSASRDWDRFIAWLESAFPDAARWAEEKGDAETKQFDSSLDGAKLTMERSGSRLRASLEVGPPLPVEDRIAGQSLFAIEQEIEALRANESALPYPIWRQDPLRRVIWVNDAYLDALRNLHGPDAASRWPTPPIFDADAVAEAADHDTSLRISLGRDAGESWHEVHTHPAGDDLICCAINIDQTIRAEKKLRGFTQTLTKTFADLPVGMAIFDHRKRLVVFNPALVELTQLSIGFLAGNPALGAVLDRMRDAGRVPEPRNYTAWRQKFVSLDILQDGSDFLETWTLSDGQTIRVTARPHPDGAVAFIFEDITSELSLTRRFRAELDAGQSALDQIDEAVAVFSATGILTMSNEAYRTLWGVEDHQKITPLAISDAAKIWEARSLPSMVWRQAMTFVHEGGVRAPWSSDFTMRNGRTATFRIVPLSGGSTLIGFTPHTATSGELRFKRRAS